MGAHRDQGDRPWSPRERLGESDIAELITAYRDGATATSLAATHGVSLRGVKRFLNTAGSAEHHPPDDPRRPHRRRISPAHSCPGIHRAHSGMRGHCARRLTLHDYALVAAADAALA